MTNYDKDIRKQVDAMLEKGVMPPDNMLLAAGYQPEYIAAMLQGNPGTQSVIQEAFKSGMTPEEFALTYPNKVDDFKLFVQTYNDMLPQMQLNAAREDAGITNLGKRYNQTQYNLFMEDLNTQKDKNNIAGQIAAAVLRGNITEEQGEALNKKFGIG